MLNSRAMNDHNIDYTQLANDIKHWAKELGFQQAGISHGKLQQHETYLTDWLSKGYQGDMAYMQRHGNKRSRPQELIPGTTSIISVRIDYLPPNANIVNTLNDPDKAFISRYAVGRDYHKLIRKRLAKLANMITAITGPFNYRPFADSAPVMEKPLAEQAGLGWQGKHTNLLNRQAGSWFFLGTLYTDLPLPADKPVKNHCGTCTACLDICPTQAIVAPYQLDAARCISYLTIELRGSIPVELRPLIGNRVYGCDDCQLTCPWNRFAKPTTEQDFHPRHKLDSATLIDLFNWTEEEFDKNTEGSAIRRIGYACWLRNMAIGLGNAPFNPAIIDTLQQKQHHSSELVREHVAWAITQQQAKASAATTP